MCKDGSYIKCFRLVGEGGRSCPDQVDQPGALLQLYQVGKQLKMSGIEPEAFRMRNRCSTTELHPLLRLKLHN